MRETGSNRNISTHYMHLFTAIVLAVSLYSCAPKKQEEAGGKMPDDSVTLHRNLLSQLPANLQPAPALLANMPAPASSKVPPVSSSDVHVFSNSISGLPVAEDAQGKALFTTYTSDEGLALDAVYCSYKDHNGNIWFGTNGGGVSKYDGRRFTNFYKLHGLPNNVIWCIAEDKQGNMWFGTDGNGLCRYDGKQFTNFTTKDGLADDVVYSIREDKAGNLWIGCLKGGVSKFDGKRFTSLTTNDGLASNTVHDILVGNNGDIWFATMGGGVSCFNGKKITSYSTANGLTSDSVRCLCEDKNGNIWLGTSGSHLLKFDGKQFTQITNSAAGGLGEISAVSQDRDGNIWIATRGAGVLKYDGRRFANYTTRHGLVSNNVRCITEDNRGNLWFGTFGGGISKFEGKSFSNYTVAEGLAANAVYSMVEDNTGAIWMGTYGGGISRYNRNSITNYRLPPGIASNYIYATAKDSHGNLWFGTFEGGAVKFDGKTYTNYTTAQGLANNVVFCIHEDRAGNIWFGTSGGVSKFDGTSFTNFTTKQGLTNNEVFCMYEDGEGNFWLGTSGAGLSFFNGKSFTNMGVAQGLPDNLVWCISPDSMGNIWVGTQQGLALLAQKNVAAVSRFAGGDTTFKSPLFQIFTSADGLPDNFITQVIEHRKGLLYVGSNQGICEMLPGDTTGSRGWHTGKIFNSASGYPVKDVNGGMGATIKDSKGIFWIGTGSDKTGVVRFDPSQNIDRAEQPPVLVIQGLKINQEQVAWSDLSLAGNSAKDSGSQLAEEIVTFGKALGRNERNALREKFSDIKFNGISSWYPLPQNLVLTHNTNTISFDFNAIELGKNSLVTYQYMLEGYDKQWSPPTRENSATFGNIYEGRYRFVLRAKAADGAWSQPVTFSFRVMPPWWRTWWMYLVYAVSVFTLVFGIVRWNNKRILQQKHDLEQKVTVATYEIRREKENVEAQKKMVEATLKDLKLTQAQLIQAEKMASLGELTAGIAHEIQNPLNFVNNFSEISQDLVTEMNEELENGEIETAKEIAGDIKQNLEKIYHHGKRAESIVSGMLEHSRMSSGQKLPSDLNKLCDEFMRLSYHGIRAKDKSFNSDMQMHFEEGMEKINIIPQDMGRVILNLVTNAFHAVHERSKSGEAGYKPTVSVSTKRLADTVELVIADNGNGIPDKIKSKIFQPFFTTKPTGQGTGLGLSLSYDIVKAHGGEIVVDTKPGSGTSFTVILPV